ncbi:molybdopterin molybdotransferase MoeA [Moritella sp. 36]|uniref:molybdopterin molybdotransferase MoeA n=1 Tax=unclassified Moritella TaxID=2637987 RepID=UPI001BAA49A9|nr:MULTISPECIES: molybdopterin molybdotransferase MoeA [unclassified Moritella]QUM81333.1 molybdopterin molybdotransferase MoeA [Moritella sp. 5]QUM89874.1 molybdopterin molybdotransferase MoeA [Moritella sp. 36]
MGCCDVQGLKPLDLAMQEMLADIDVVKETLTLNLADALDYILAEDIVSPINVPPFDNSAMDGYAIRISDLTQSMTLPLAGKAFAGQPFNDVWPLGTCIRIMTGAPVPAGCEAVIMQERTQVDGDLVTFEALPPMHDNIRNAAEDIAVGQAVLTTGRRLTPRDIPMLASIGIDAVTVYRRLKVAIFSTGDELKSLGQPLANGEIYDSNRYSITAMLSRLNLDIIDFGIVPDDEVLLRETFIKADAAADAVITSGGVSVGEADYTKILLEELGEIGFWKLAIKPGKPFAFGTLPNSKFFGLPGNPVSATVTFHQLVVPALAKMTNQVYTPTPRFNAIAATKLKKAPGRMDFQRAIYSVNADGQLEVISTGSQGSGVFSSMSHSNCYAILEQDRGNVEIGETVTIEPFNEILN